MHELNLDEKIYMEELINIEDWKRIDYVLESISGKEKEKIEILIRLHNSIGIVAPAVIRINYNYHSITSVDMGWGDPSVTSDYCYTHWDLTTNTVLINCYSLGRDYGLLCKKEISEVLYDML